MAVLSGVRHLCAGCVVVLMGGLFGVPAHGETAPAGSVPAPIPMPEGATPTAASPRGPAIPSAALPARLRQPTPSVAREVVSGESYMGRDMLQTSVQAAWLPTHGPWVGGYLGMYRAFSVHMGLTREAVRVQTGKTSTSEAGDFAVAWGFNFASLAYNGWQGNAGLFYVGLKYMRVHASLAMPLNSHWLPKRVADLRLRLHYMTAGDHDTPAGLGLGIEWGAW